MGATRRTALAMSALLVGTIPVAQAAGSPPASADYGCDDGSTGQNYFALTYGSSITNGNDFWYFTLGHDNPPDPRYYTNYEYQTAGGGFYAGSMSSQRTFDPNSRGLYFTVTDFVSGGTAQLYSYKRSCVR